MKGLGEKDEGEDAFWRRDFEGLAVENVGWKVREKTKLILGSQPCTMGYCPKVGKLFSTFFFGISTMRVAPVDGEEETCDPLIWRRRDFVSPARARKWRVEGG